MFNYLRTAIRRAGEQARRRHGYVTVLQFDDHMLDDIGIRREDIRREMASARGRSS